MKKIVRKQELVNKIYEHFRVVNGLEKYKVSKGCDITLACASISTPNLELFNKEAKRKNILTGQ